MEYTAALENSKNLTGEWMVAEQLVPSTKRPLPASPFPRKYVHSVFVDLQDAERAAQALRSAGFDEQNVYVLKSSDFIEAMSRNLSPLAALTSMGYDIYMREALCGHAFLAVCPANYSQLRQIRDLLAPHNARHAKYIETWTVAELLP